MRIPFVSLNRTNVKAKFYALTLCATACLTQASAQDYQESCESILQSCFAYSHQARSSCLFAKAEAVACSNSSTGGLAKTRAQLDLHALPTDYEDAPEEPYTLDAECLRNFDHLWLSALVNENESQDTIDTLETSLLSCVKQAHNELLRP